ncbi:hypothetical protein UFOVP55_42 [uncultured Caudovirales phage]|uniref:Uncharacterized protein n=1 Tax=uncultured Caudovirales phage TaxID=2100421 RepID=A0A6J5KXJ1_9CAUD|nr:hypothetical protein UFOVP55_42 [uncultured Caudovirales phage]
MSDSLLNLTSYEEYVDLCEWMAREGACEGTDLDEALWGFASDWLLSLDLEIYPASLTIPRGYADPIAACIADWLEVLSCHEDSDPFLSEVISNSVE